jgi:chromosome segregation ATPase
MSDNSLNNNEKLLIQLEQKLNYLTDNYNKVFDLTKEIFSKIDQLSKEYVDIKTKLEPMKITHEMQNMQIVELSKKIDEAIASLSKKAEDSIRELNEKINTNKTDLNECKSENDEEITGIKESYTKAMESLSKNYNDQILAIYGKINSINDDISKAKGAISMVKFVYPLLAIAMQIISVLVTLKLKG